jgi:hypothetical protein
MKGGAMSRLSRVLLAVAVAAAATAPSAVAVPEKKLSTTLGALWTTVIQTPAADNPFTGGDPCIDLGGTLAPFAGPAEFTCTVKPGIKIFVVGWSSECSTVEAPPYHGDDEASLRDCARSVDAGLATPTVSLDGSRVALTEVETALLEFVLPPGHIFDPALPAGTRGQSVGHGWVVLLHPLTPGSHVIRIEVCGIYLGAPFESINTTTIRVRPGA